MKYHQVIKAHAIGDSLLLPYEFLKQDLGAQRLEKYGLKQSLIFGYGLTSDDNDHLLMTAQALFESKDAIEFRKKLRLKLKLWLLTLPVGIGMTTLKAILKMWLGCTQSGIESSGNGPLMRVPIIALKFSENDKMRHLFIEASTVMTHKSMQSQAASQGIGNFIAYLANNDNLPSKENLITVLSSLDEPVWNKYIRLLQKNINLPLEDFLKVIHCEKGVTGYIMPTAVFSIYVLYQPENTFKQLIKAGGDTDTIGALVGAYLALYNKEHIFTQNNLNFFPLLRADLKIEEAVHHRFWLFLIIKNMILIPTVLIHGVLRKVLEIINLIK